MRCKIHFVEFGAKISVLPKYLANNRIDFPVGLKGLNPYLCALKIFFLMEEIRMNIFFETSYSFISYL